MVVIENDKDILLERDFNFVDMHHHSTCSDGNKTPAYIAKVCKKKHVGIALTDHNTIAGSLYICRQKGIFAIPGIEVTSNSCKDVLGYFRNINDLKAFYAAEIYAKTNRNLISYNRTIHSTMHLVEKIKYHGGIAVLAHPFAPLMKSSYKLLENKEFLKAIDGIESHNFAVGGFDLSYNYARKFDKPLTAGSDSHGMSSFNTLVGSTKFELDSFLDSLLKQKTFIYHSLKNPFRKAYENLTVLKNYVTPYKHDFDLEME
jgi:predicted metal-dependent phosphoesterase TrpH